MTVKDYIEEFYEEHEHVFPQETILKWINRVEQNVYADNVEDFRIQYYTKKLNYAQFPLPSGVDYMNIVDLFVDGRQYKKKDARAYREPYTFWEDNGIIFIYPACSSTDISVTGDVVFTDSTITGEGFRFQIGDTVLVSGSTDNDKYATIISATDTVLTFPDDTFTAGADNATIAKPSIKMVYRYIPIIKSINDIVTDTLLFPERFHDIYDYYLLSKIAIHEKDYGSVQNLTTLYNSRVADFMEWWENNRPQKPIHKIVAGYGDEYLDTLDTLDFDRR